MAGPAVRPSRRPSPKYSRMFSGASLVVTGAIGFDVNHMHGFFEGGRWVDGPVWGQIALGTGFLLLGVYWSRRLGDPGGTPARDPREQNIENAWQGKTWWTRDASARGSND